MTTKYASHVGMNFQCPTVKLFCFQLVHNGYAHASVDFVDGKVDRVGTTPPLVERAPAIVRLAKIYQRRLQS